jgi:GT2 family glycosyltransferase
MIEPRVAIIVLNWNGWKDTLECLDSVFRLEYDNYVVIVCDNASTDDSVDQIRSWASAPSPVVSPNRPPLSGGRPLPPVIALSELTRGDVETGAEADRDARMILIHNGDNLGFAQGNNVGLQHSIAGARFDYVWLLNNDVVVDKDALHELVRCAQSEPDIGAVGSTIYEYAEPDVVQAAGGGVFSRNKVIPQLIRSPRRGAGQRPDQAPDLDFISGACMLIGVSELRQVGLIDEAFFIYCEDVDIGVRIRNAGRRLVHAQESRIWHKGGSTIGHRSVRHDYYTVRNMFALVRKHYPRKTLRVGVYLLVYALLPKIVRGQWGRIGAAWRGYIDYRSGVVGRVQI